MIEEVKKIIHKTVKVSSFDARDAKLHNVDEAAKEIDVYYHKLFEPKPETDIRIIKGTEHPEERIPIFKPDKGGLLTIDEIKANPSYNEYLKTMSYGGAQRACQRDLTASIVDKQARQDERTEWIKALMEESILVAESKDLKGIRKALEQVVRQEMVEEIEGYFDDEPSESGLYTRKGRVVKCHLLRDKEWQELKRGVK